MVFKIVCAPCFVFDFFLLLVFAVLPQAGVLRRERGAVRKAFQGGRRGKLAVLVVVLAVVVLGLLVVAVVYGVGGGGGGGDYDGAELVGDR